MIHDANRCLCQDCMDYRAAAIRRRARMGLRPIPQIPPVAATRDAAAGATTTEPDTSGLGQMSSTAGETLPIPRDAAGAVLDDYPAHSYPGVSGLAVHRGPVVAARAATNGEPRLGEAS